MSDYGTKRKEKPFFAETKNDTDGNLPSVSFAGL